MLNTEENMVVTVAFDSGTSGSKVIAGGYLSAEYPYPQTEKFFFIEPFYKQLTERTYKQKLGQLDKLLTSLVSFYDRDWGQVYIEVGESVAEPGMLPVHNLKSQTLIAKVLSFLGFLSEKSCKRREWELSLGLLLPLDEYSDRKPIENKLRSILRSGFEYNGQMIDKISLAEENLFFSVEGFGVGTEYNTRSSSEDDRIAVLVMGHSDSTWLIMKNGVYDLSESVILPETGMHDLLRNINYPIAYELKFAAALAKSGKNLKEKPLKEVLANINQQELERLKIAIIDAREQYWLDLRRRFLSLKGKDVSKCYITGGLCNYFSDRLPDLFKQEIDIKLFWCRDLMLDFHSRFDLKKKTDVLHRFADVYGLYRYLLRTHPETSISIAPTLQSNLVVKNG